MLLYNKPSTNPYAQRILSDHPDLIFADHRAENLKGGWNQMSPRIILEIGCNGGHVLLPLAQKNPDTLYLGLDWKHKQIYLAAQKTKKLNLNNIRFIRAHAERLPFMFAPHELDELWIYFPDPWPKRAQWKNRFLTPARLTQIYQILKPDKGLLKIKTDHPEYFEWVLKAITDSQMPWKTIMKTCDLHAHNPEAQKLTPPEVTLFEKLFIKQKLPIYALTLQT